jgi:hypothetical protein
VNHNAAALFYLGCLLITKILFDHHLFLMYKRKAPFLWKVIFIPHGAAILQEADLSGDLLTQPVS